MRFYLKSLSFIIAREQSDILSSTLKKGCAFNNISTFIMRGQDCFSLNEKFSDKDGTISNMYRSLNNYKNIVCNVQGHLTLLGDVHGQFFTLENIVSSPLILMTIFQINLFFSTKYSLHHSGSRCFINLLANCAMKVL